jgi:Integrase core domain
VILQRAMFGLLIRVLLVVRSFFAARASREAEVLVLGRQLLVFSRKTRRHRGLWNIDRLIWVWLYRLFPSIRDHPVAAPSPWQNGYVERLIGSIRRECSNSIQMLSMLMFNLLILNFRRRLLMPWDNNTSTLA